DRGASRLHRDRGPARGRGDHLDGVVVTMGDGRLLDLGPGDRGVPGEGLGSVDDVVARGMGDPVPRAIAAGPTLVVLALLPGEARLGVCARGLIVELPSGGARTGGREQPSHDTGGGAR